MPPRQGRKPTVSAKAIRVKGRAVQSAPSMRTTVVVPQVIVSGEARKRRYRQYRQIFVDLLLVFLVTVTMAVITIVLLLLVITVVADLDGPGAVLAMLPPAVFIYGKADLWQGRCMARQMYGKVIRMTGYGGNGMKRYEEVRGNSNKGGTLTGVNLPVHEV